MCKGHLLIDSSLVHLEADRDHLFSWILLWLYGLNLSTIAIFTPAQKICSKGETNLKTDKRDIQNVQSSGSPGPGFNTTLFKEVSSAHQGCV